MTLSLDQVRWFRLHRSGLVEPFPSPESAASTLVGIQAQILPAAALALCNRTRSLTYEVFDNLLYKERVLVKLWGQRGTLHLYPSHEWPLIYSAITYRSNWWNQRAEELGMTVTAYRDLISKLDDLLRQQGTLGRSDLRAANLGLDDELFSSWGGIFHDLVRHGYACHAGQLGNQGHFAHREHWLPDLSWAPPQSDEANIELFRRYLHVYGPATLQDFAYWRYVPARDAHCWLTALADEVSQVTIEGKSMLVLQQDLDLLHRAPPLPQIWPICLLYRFDPLLLGHKDKSWLIDIAYYKRVWRTAGHIEGVILEKGRISGTWRYDRRGNGMTVTLYPFNKMSRRAALAVARHATGVANFFNLPLTELVIAEG